MNALARLWGAGWTVRLALLVVVGVLVIAVAGPVLAPYDPLAQDTANALQESSFAHLFGTDYLGRDVLSRLLAGAPASLLSALGAAVIGLVIGAVPGALSAFAPKVGEWLSLRVVDALLSLPFILFAIVFAALLGNGLLQATLAIGILIAPSFFRIARAATLRVRDSQYVEAATFLGGSAWWVLRQHVWRQVAPNLVVASVSALGVHCSPWPHSPSSASACSHRPPPGAECSPATSVTSRSVRSALSRPRSPSSSPSAR